jgi:hypothetical protein
MKADSLAALSDTCSFDIHFHNQLIMSGGQEIDEMCSVKKDCSVQADLTMCIRYTQKNNKFQISALSDLVLHLAQMYTSATKTLSLRLYIK